MKRTVSEAQRLVAYAVKIGGLVVSKETEVDIKQAAASMSGDAYERFHAVCNREISKLIVGQVLSSDAQSTGLGSGVAKGQENVRQDIRQFDGAMLASTLRTELFEQYLRINGLPGRAPRAAWGAESYDNAKIIGEVIQALANGGLELTDDSIAVINERLGFGIQRRASAIPVTSMMSLAATDSIARGRSAELARAFRGGLAPVRQIILSSASHVEAEQRLMALYPDWTAAKRSAVLAEALQIAAGSSLV